jgi:hypothetical protein
MEDMNGRATSTAAPAAIDSSQTQYEPPAVAWEEEFSPVADSCGLDPDCHPFSPPGEGE